MFPQFLAIVAIYLMFTNISDLYPAIGLNTPAGLLLLYLGGALGVNTWLMKGFFDTVPRELDESAQGGRRDATPRSSSGSSCRWSRRSWRSPALLGFIGTINEFLMASVFLTRATSKTLAVGLYGLIAGERNANFGMFAAGTLLTAIPTVVLF